MRKIALVTGATAGFGKAIAAVAKLNYDLILTGRNKERLNQVMQTIKNQYDVEIFPSFMMFGIMMSVKKLSCQFRKV